MLTNIAKKIFGSRNDRLLKQYRKSVAKINALESEMQALSDESLQAKTAEFKQRLADGQTLDDILVEAFAVCREASRRVLGMRHFDVQLIGGMVLHNGKIAEMRTGEGKTLVATLAVYLNALSGKGVHVVTVNDYLASRDAGIMAPLYNFLGLTVGVIIADMQPFDRQNAYGADITYGTNNEFGFDYLRDNMVTDQYDKVQRELNFAVVDEVDSILIDEARTPLIISGQADDNVQLYQIMDAIPAQLVRQETEEGEGDYWVDEKAHQVILSEAGHEHAEQILTQMGLLQENDSLYSAANIALMHHLMAALRAHSLFHKDQHYVIQDGEIVIVDEFTGRLMSGRRWSEGLHKEHEREALIVAQAGKVGAITVATNMAGRGTDIVLGGSLKHQIDAIRADETLSDEEKQAQISALENGWQAEHDRVVAAGGLHIVGTERHESRRIDNQLRGRAGRQGDPGSSRFYLSFEDPLLRLFALDRAAAILNRLAPERGVAIEHGLLTRQIEGAQRKVEGRNFDMRKQVLEYDDVANDQRKVIYHQRNEILNNQDVSDLTKGIREEVISDLVDLHIPPDSMEEQWDIPALEHQLEAEFRLSADIRSWLEADNTLDGQDIKERLIDRIETEYAEKTELVGKKPMADFERNVMLQVIDTQWREHLAAMDYLRQGIHLRSYAQKNPKQEYKREAFAMFENLWRGIKQNIASLLASVQIERNTVPEEMEERTPTDIHATHSGAPDMEELLGESQTDLVTEAFDPTGNDFSLDTLAEEGRIVHRNELCPCGSGLKYKQCHGKLN